MRLWVWWQMTLDPIKSLSEIIRALERLGSFALVAYVLLFGFPEIKKQLEAMTATQQEIVVVLRELNTDIKSVNSRMDTLERIQRGK